MHFLKAGWRNGKLSNLKKQNNTVSKTLIYNAHEAIPCAPEFSVFGRVGAHEVWSCAFSVFEISDFERIFFFSFSLFFA